MKDIAPELLEKLQKEFKKKFESSNKLKKLNKLLLDKKTTHKDSNDFAIAVGEILSQVFQENLSASDLPDGKMYYNIADRILNPTLRENHNIVSNFAKEVQTELNHKAGLRLQGKAARLNQDRIDGIINRISSEDEFEKVKWLLDEPVVNFSQSIVDDTIKDNVEFHYKLGLGPRIIRKESGSCCGWCKVVVGTYKYPNVPKDVYRRHRYCRCTVEYDPGDGKRQNVHSKKWYDSEKYGKIEKRKEIPPKENDRIKRIAYDKARELGYYPLPDNKVVEVLRKDSDELIKNLTEDEKKAITKYTYNGVDKDGLRLFEKINGYLEGRYNPINQKELDILDINTLNIEHGILKNKLKHDIIVYRNDRNPSNLEGTIKKFLSTSVTRRGVIKNNPNIVIIVPKGSKGAYVENLAEYDFKKQREFLIDRGSRLRKIHFDRQFVLYVLEE